MEVTKPLIQDKKPSEAIEPDILKLGNNLVIKIHMLMKLGQIYGFKNVALHHFFQESFQIINALIKRDGSLSLKIVNEDLFLNDRLLRYSLDGFTSFKYLLIHWKKWLIGEVIFKESVDDGILRAFIYTLINLKEGCEENAVLLTEQLLNQGISSIEVEPLEVFERRGGGEGKGKGQGKEEREGRDKGRGEREGEGGALTLRMQDQKRAAKTVFFETIAAIKEFMTNINKGNLYADVDVRKLKRLAQKAVRLVLEDESFFLGMASIKNYDEYTFNHSVNVAIYSLAIGRRLGFSRRTLTELGITALLHDIGKSKIPKTILNKPGSLDEMEWEVMKKHPVEGVEIVLNLKQLGAINPETVFGIFEHHLKNNLSGYPKLFKKKEMSLFGQIIQITDAYDAITTPRIYKKTSSTPEQALAIMLRDRGTHFDPILLKIFIGLVGTYPIGSLVLLNTHEFGIVYEPHPKRVDRPQVILVARDKKGYPKKELVDLTETDGEGRFRWSIIKTLDPLKYHIDIGKYFL